MDDQQRPPGHDDPREGERRPPPEHERRDDPATDSRPAPRSSERLPPLFTRQNGDPGEEIEEAEVRPPEPPRPPVAEVGPPEPRRPSAPAAAGWRSHTTPPPDTAPPGSPEAEEPAQPERPTVPPLDVRPPSPPPPPPPAPPVARPDRTEVRPPGPRRGPAEPGPLTPPPVPPLGDIQPQARSWQPAPSHPQAADPGPGAPPQHGAPGAERRPARILALANQKGGVGKTTSAINLGAALAELGSRVLLVDMDPQGSLGLGMGTDPHAMDRTVYNLLMQDGTGPDEVILETSQPRLHLLPANIDLAAAEVLLVQEVAREQALRRVLDRLRYRYDFILIDCPPSLGLLTINGLTAADGVIVPLECEYFALRGMSLLMNTIQKVQERLNTQLELKGILATMLDARTLHSREVLERVHEAFGDVVFKTTVSKTIRFAEAPVAGEPILSYAPENKGAEAYRELAKEVLSRESAP